MGIGIVAALALLAAPAAADEACEVYGDSVYDPEPTTMDYLSGRVCPPEDFPYQPNIIGTDAGQRAVDPYTDGCSSPGEEKTPFFNRWNACATHDYGYDLWRHGTVGVGKNEVDQIFYEDMLADCKGRNIAAKHACQQSAKQYRSAVEFLGRPSDGDEIRRKDAGN
jgi:hypothetical protein